MSPRLSTERTAAALVFVKPERLRAPSLSAHAQARDLKIMSVTSMTVGIDVAKAHTDVCVLEPKSGAQRVTNDPEAHSALAALLRRADVGWVVSVSHRGCLAVLACPLRPAGLPVAVVNPRQAADFAKS